MDGEIIDTENYRGNDDVGNFKEIVMKQFQRVVSNISQEMREGIKIYSYIKMREPELTKYLPDTRKQLVQSMDCLHDILQPKFDKEMKSNSKEILERIEGIKEDAQNEKEYWKNKLKIYRELFQLICFQLERLGWLESLSFEE